VPGVRGPPARGPRAALGLDRGARQQSLLPPTWELLIRCQMVAHSRIAPHPRHRTPRFSRSPTVGRPARPRGKSWGMRK
jgi:hypothetical protein